MSKGNTITAWIYTSKQQGQGYKSKDIQHNNKVRQTTTTTTHIYTYMLYITTAEKQGIKQQGKNSVHTDHERERGTHSVSTSLYEGLSTASQSAEEESTLGNGGAEGSATKDSAALSEDRDISIDRHGDMQLLTNLLSYANSNIHTHRPIHTHTDTAQVCHTV